MTITNNLEDDNENYFNSTKNSPPDAQLLSLPPSNRGPRYPFNHTRETESGHLHEFDDTPGVERINMRHRTGTGYEIDSSGMMKQVIVGNGYVAVAGQYSIQVTGQCHIVAVGNVSIKSTGDVNIDATNDVNIHAGGTFNVSCNDYVQKVTGKKAVNITGDVTESVDGFKKVGIKGDYQVDAGSVNHTARLTSITNVALKDINNVSIENTNNYAGKINTTASKDKTIISSAGVEVSSKGDVVVASKDGKMTIKGGTDTHIGGPGNLHLLGSNLKVNKEIESALFATKAQFAGIIGEVGEDTKTAANGQDVPDDSKTQEKTDPKKNTETLDKYNPIDITKTQTGGHGPDAQVNVWNKGFDAREA